MKELDSKKADQQTCESCEGSQHRTVAGNPEVARESRRRGRRAGFG
jgi:hypothetical protein